MKPLDKALMKIAGVPFWALGKINRFKGYCMQKSIQAEPGKIYSFRAESIDGKPVELSQYKGQVLLIVNLASLCGFTPQYEPLEKLYRLYKDRGLRVLGFPANNFGGQEPGSNGEIKSFCSSKYSVTFDLFAKTSVKGPDIDPLFRFLTQEAGIPGDIPWNFSKFLIDRNGRLAERYGPETDPLSKSLTEKIEALLR